MGICLSFLILIFFLSANPCQKNSFLESHLALAFYHLSLRNGLFFCSCLQSSYAMPYVSNHHNCFRFYHRWVLFWLNRQKPPFPVGSGFYVFV
ncbi:hypothetical protein BKA66DRAFT_129944 [Pyrenochaeta sp. MPI-SDFR-AT-0127]|nr:hypothetical protein BKA66DRAFT_129944 [Pyrenochaeta sp. MPI-SDFR-AT-0127]